MKNSGGEFVNIFEIVFLKRGVDDDRRAESVGDDLGGRAVKFRLNDERGDPLFARVAHEFLEFARGGRLSFVFDRSLFDSEFPRVVSVRGVEDEEEIALERGEGVASSRLEVGEFLIELGGVRAERIFRVGRELDERFENLGDDRASDLRARPKMRIEGGEFLFVMVGVVMGGGVFVGVLSLMAMAVRIREEFESATQVDDHGVRSD